MAAAGLLTVQRIIDADQDDGQDDAPRRNPLRTVKAVSGVVSERHAGRAAKGAGLGARLSHAAAGGRTPA